MKSKHSLVSVHSSARSPRVALVKPSAAKAMAGVGRRGMGDIKRHALAVADLSLSADVPDIRRVRGFAPVGLEYQVLAWPKL
jgi:hypothetical protein